MNMARVGIVVRRLGFVGATEHGEHVAVEITDETGGQAMLMFPFGLYQKLMLALTTAGTMAYNAQLERLKTPQNVIDYAGFSAFWPSDYRLGRGQAPDGADVILMRFCRDTMPIIDVMMPPAMADEFATLVKKEAGRTPSPPPAKN